MTPSSESLLHAGIYSARADVGGIAHTHAVYSSAVAAAGNGDSADCGRDGCYAGRGSAGVGVRATGIGRGGGAGVRGPGES